VSTAVRLEALDKTYDGGVRVVDGLDLDVAPGELVALLGPSGRQRLVEPRVLLLDEPLSQLDAALRVEMRELVRRVQQEVGVTTLFVTHDQEEAVVVADRVALMLDGRLQQYDVPQAFYERPASLRVARFFGSANALDGVVRDGVFTSGPVRVPVAAPDGPGVLVLRQEAVRVVGADEEGLDAVVVRTAYTGTAVRAWVDAGGTELALVVEPTRRLAGGDRLRVQLPAEHCTVLPPDGLSAP